MQRRQDNRVTELLDCVPSDHIHSNTYICSLLIRNRRSHKKPVTAAQLAISLDPTSLTWQSYMA